MDSQAGHLLLDFPEEENDYDARFRPPRVICLLDVDCYEAQLYCRYHRDFKEQPFIVVNAKGVILAVNYPAKNAGISRSMHEKEARRAVPGIRRWVIPNHPKWEKPMVKAKRRGSFQIRNVIVDYLKRYPNITFEASSCDEFFLDLTQEVEKRMKENPIPCNKKFPPKTVLEMAERKVFGEELTKRVTKGYEADLLRNGLHTYWEEAMMFYGLQIAFEITTKVKKALGIDLSAGISSSKILAKMAVSINKPNGYTILPLNSLPRVSRDMDIRCVPGLGGIQGDQIKKKFGFSKMADLHKLSDEDWRTVFDEPGDEERLSRIRKSLLGDDGDAEVVPKLFNQTIRVGKVLKEHQLITKRWELKERLLYLAEETEERLFEEKFFNNRIGIRLEVWIHGNPWGPGKRVRVDIRDLARKVNPYVDLDKFSNSTEMRDRALAALEEDVKGDLEEYDGILNGICVKEIIFRVDFEEVSKRKRSMRGKGRCMCRSAIYLVSSGIILYMFVILLKLLCF